MINQLYLLVKFVCQGEDNTSLEEREACKADHFRQDTVIGMETVN